VGWLYVSFVRWERVQVKLGSGALHMHAGMYSWYTDWIEMMTASQADACVLLAFTVQYVAELERRVGGQKIHETRREREGGREREGLSMHGDTEKSTGLVGIVQMRARESERVQTERKPVGQSTLRNQRMPLILSPSC